VAKAKLRTYVDSSDAFVRELKGLRARLDTGMTYSQYSEKMQGVLDEYAQCGDPPADSQDAQRFATYSADALEQYRRALREWKLGVDTPQLAIAQKYRCKEIWQSADLHVQSALLSYDSMKTSLR
jgi:hypothetical protein